MEQKQALKITYKELVSGYSWTNFETNRSSGNTALERNIDLAVQYIESQCMTGYGFLSQVSSDTCKNNEWNIAIPNIFDSALIINILASTGLSLSPVIVDSVKKMLLESRNVEGVWNFFQKEHHIIPCDMDTSSNTILGLYFCGVEKEIVAQMTSNLLEKCVVHNDGLIDIYLPISANASNKNGGQPINNWPPGKRIDLVTTANFLFLLNKLGVNHLPRLSSCYDMLLEAVEDFKEKRYGSPIISLYAKSYKNEDIICFFISRLIGASTYKADIFKEKVAKHVESRLLSDCTNPLSLACRIMTAINCALQKNEESKVLIQKELENLMLLQNKQNFSYSKVVLYNAHNIYNFGSSAISTAFAIGAMSAGKFLVSENSENHFTDTNNNYNTFKK